MTLEKAIETLIDSLDQAPRFSPDNRREAVSLGIEALKRLQQLRTSRITWFRGPLPSETEQQKVIT